MNITLYANGSSKNHGCEAIWRSTMEIFNLSPEQVFYLSPNLDDERRYQNPIPEKRLIASNFARQTKFFAKAVNKVTDKALNRRFLPEKYDTSFYSHPFGASALALSCGGDNYCYDKALWLAAANQEAAKIGVPCVLWGCSVEPAVLQDKGVAADLRSYALITARESITYEALLEAGIDKNTMLFPDPAFYLTPGTPNFPENFQPGNTVGINASPLALGLSGSKNAALGNFRALIAYILAETDMHVALIPHVVWDFNDDRKPLQTLFDEFAATGRVGLAQDADCRSLKGLIGACRFFVGARTHATIAAYSSCVPTLTAGYSVKARGIARDLFGTEKGFVVPVQEMSEKNELVAAFLQLVERENEIRTLLSAKMPQIREQAAAAAKPALAAAKNKPEAGRG